MLCLGKMSLPRFRFCGSRVLGDTARYGVGFLGYSEGERACEPATNPIRLNRTMCHSLGAHVRRKTLQSALQVLQVLGSQEA
jgi:hypothetical protein